MEISGNEVVKKNYRITEHDLSDNDISGDWCVVTMKTKKKRPNKSRRREVKSYEFQKVENTNDTSFSSELSENLESLESPETPNPDEEPFVIVPNTDLDSNKEPPTKKLEPVALPIESTKQLSSSFGMMSLMENRITEFEKRLVTDDKFREEFLRKHRRNVYNEPEEDPPVKAKSRKEKRNKKKFDYDSPETEKLKEELGLIGAKCPCEYCDNDRNGEESKKKENSMSERRKKFIELMSSKKPTSLSVPSETKPVGLKTAIDDYLKRSKTKKKVFNNTQSKNSKCSEKL